MQQTQQTQLQQQQQLQRRLHLSLPLHITVILAFLLPPFWLTCQVWNFPSRKQTKRRAWICNRRRTYKAQKQERTEEREELAITKNNQKIWKTRREFAET